MGKGFQTFIFLILCLFYSQDFHSQKQKHFSGELTYAIERVDQKDSVKAEMIIYARDSLIRVVNFNSETGKQELIKHLRLGKSYLLLDTEKQKFAIRMNDDVKNELSFYLHKKISAKYGNAFTRLPGLPVVYYVPTDHGLYKYTLKSIKKSVPPIQLFSFGKEYKIVTLDEFTTEFSRLYDEGN